MSDHPTFESPSFPEDELDDDLDDDVDDDLEEAPDGPEEPAVVAAEPAGNRLAGGAPKAVLEHLARSIVDDPEAVEVEAADGRGGLTLSLHVAPGDMGRVIGKRGRVAQALRTLVRAAAAREGTDATVDIVD